jgi:hypothetical protein
MCNTHPMAPIATHCRNARLLRVELHYCMHFIRSIRVSGVSVYGPQPDLAATLPVS